MKRIGLKLAGGEGLSYADTPLTFGVPFADGELEKEAAVRIVDENGGALPVQTQCLTTWNDDLKFVKWLLVDLQAGLAGGGERELFLEYPADEPPPEPEQRVRVEEDETFLCVDTGPMRLSLKHTFEAWRPPHNPDVFARCLVQTGEGWQDLFRGNPGPFLYMKDQFGNGYDSCTTGPAPRVVVEESGPLRVCIRIDGYHAMGQGQRFCPYVLRVHLFAGKSDMRIHHTFIYDQEPHCIELSAIGMAFPLDLGGDLRGSVGGEGEAHWSTNWQEMQALQADDLQYAVSLDGEVFGSGEKAGGWASLSGDRGGVVAVVKDFWQEYPKGFALSKDGIDVQIWPGSFGENLAFTTPFEEPAILFGNITGSESLRDEAEVRRLLEENPTAPLNLKSFGLRSVEDAAWVEQVIEKYAEGRTVTYNNTSTNNGLGAAKTTEITLRLSGTAIDDTEAEGLARGVQEPLVVVVDPEYVCASRAIGHFYPAGDPRFAGVDGDLADLFETVAVDPVARCRLYGMMRYGNMVCHHSSWVYLLYKESDPAKALRYVGPYHNEAVDQMMAVWGHFIRTGKREHLLVAQHYTRAVADVGFTHAGEPDRVGIIHYHNGHTWSGQLSTSHSVVSGMVADYYMTGNRRLLDVAREVADRIVAFQEPAGILSVRRQGLHRDFTGPLSVLLDLYQATWEERYGELARRSLNWMLRTSPKPGMLPNSVFSLGERGDEAGAYPMCLPEVSWGNKYHMYEPAVRLCASKTLREFLIAEADYWVWESPKQMQNYACTTVCFAYDMTGDVNYAAYCKHMMETNFHSFVEAMRAGEHMDFQALWYSGFVPRLMRTVADAMEADPEGFEAAAEAWWEKRQGMPDREQGARPDDGPEIALGRLSTGPHPEA